MPDDISKYGAFRLVRKVETPAERWTRMRKWVGDNIVPTAEAGR